MEAEAAVEVEVAVEVEAEVEVVTAEVDGAILVVEEAEVQVVVAQEVLLGRSKTRSLAVEAPPLPLQEQNLKASEKLRAVP